MLERASGLGVELFWFRAPLPLDMGGRKAKLGGEWPWMELGGEEEVGSEVQVEGGRVVGGSCEVTSWEFMGGFGIQVGVLLGVVSGEAKRLSYSLGGTRCGLDFGLCGLVVLNYLYC